MSVYNQTYEESSMHQRPGFKPGFDVGLLYDSYKPSLHQRWDHQRSGFKPGF